MQKYDLNALIEFGDRYSAKVLVNEPSRRMVLLCLRAGQSVPEHANQERVVVYTIRGHITFYEGILPSDLHAGQVVCLESGAPHRVEAHEDSVLLVLAVGSPAVVRDAAKELDLREIPRPERHPLVFAALDALAVGDSFLLINDHDPIPLNRQIDELRAGQVTWKYERREPGMFRIRITRIAAANTAAFQA